MLKNLPEDIFNKIKYMTLEHPVARIFKKYVRMETMEVDNNTIRVLFIAKSDASLECNRSDFYHETCDKTFGRNHYHIIEKQVQYYKFLNHFLYFMMLF